MDPECTESKPQKRLVPYVIAGVCVIAVLLVVFLWKPALSNASSQASASTNNQLVQQQIDPLYLMNQTIIGSNISDMTYGLTLGTDYEAQTVTSTTNAYTIALTIQFLGIADEQDSLILYTDSATDTINTVEYYAAVPKSEKSALLKALDVKMNALTSTFGDSYETAYYKDTQTQSADTSYTYQKIYDAFSADQAGIYSINWPMSGFVVVLKVYNQPDQDSYALQISYWAYTGTLASATP